MLHSARYAARFGGRLALPRLASGSPDAFLDTLANLDIFVAIEASRATAVITQLERLQADLEAELMAVQPNDLGARRARVAQSVGTA